MLDAEIRPQFAWALLENLPPGRPDSQLRQQIAAARREVRAIVIGCEQVANGCGIDGLVFPELRRVDLQRVANRHLHRRAALIPADVDKPGLKLVWWNVDTDLPHHPSRSGSRFVGLPFSSRYWTLPCGPSKSRTANPRYA